MAVASRSGRPRPRRKKTSCFYCYCFMTSALRLPLQLGGEVTTPRVSVTRKTFDRHERVG